MTERLLDIKRDAALIGKEIDYVEMSKAEAETLIRENKRSFPCIAKPQHLEGTLVFGMRIKINNKVSS